MQGSRNKIIQSVTLTLTKLIPIITISHIYLSIMVDSLPKNDS